MSKNPSQRRMADKPCHILKNVGKNSKPQTSGITAESIGFTTVSREYWKTAKSGPPQLFSYHHRSASVPANKYHNHFILI